VSRVRSRSRSGRDIQLQLDGVDTSGTGTGTDKLSKVPTVTGFGDRNMGNDQNSWRLTVAAFAAASLLVVVVFATMANHHNTVTKVRRVSLSDEMRIYFDNLDSLEHQCDNMDENVTVAKCMRQERYAYDDGALPSILQGMNLNELAQGVFAMEYDVRERDTAELNALGTQKNYTCMTDKDAVLLGKLLAVLIPDPVVVQVADQMVDFAPVTELDGGVVWERAQIKDAKARTITTDFSSLETAIDVYSASVNQLKWCCPFQCILLNTLMLNGELMMRSCCDVYC